MTAILGQTAGGIPGWWFIAAIIGYLCVMAANPVRRNLADGVRVLRRYPEVWGILSVLGLGYVVWQLGVTVFYHHALPEGQRPVFVWARAFFLPQAEQFAIFRGSVLPAAESVAGIFNNLVTTFPVSVIAALLLLSNWEGHNAVLNRALRRRFGGAGWLIYSLVILCALAAVVKPVLYVALPMIGLNGGLWLLQLSLVVDWFSFLFEYLFGVCIQIYLILLAFVWVRGKTFTHQHLLDFAIRRFSVVMRWAAVVMVFSTLSLHLPQILSAFPGPAGWMHENLPPNFVEGWVRPALAVFLLLFFSMQITLTFHSESLVEAVRDHFRFAMRHAWKVGCFLAIAFAHFYTLLVLHRSIIAGVGAGTAAGIVWQFVYPVAQGLLGAWLLASWVSLFKSCETSRSHFETMTEGRAP